MSKTDTIALMAWAAREKDRESGAPIRYRRESEVTMERPYIEAARALYAEVERQERQAYSPTKEDDGA